MLLIILLLSAVSCVSTKHIQSSYIIKDSTIIRYDTVRIELPNQSYHTFVNFADTLKLNTDIATATAYVDFNKNMLIGDIQNKDTVLKKEIIYKDRIIYRDSIYQEVPVEKIVEKTKIPNFYHFTSFYFIGSLIILGIWLFLKIKF